MYDTVDEINKGQYFWNSLLHAWPIPFQIVETDYAVLFADHGNLAVVICKSELPGDVDRRVVQIRDIRNNSTLLEARISSEMNYISGESLGMAVDEVGAADALVLYGPMISGTWTQALSEALLLEDEQHG